MDPFFSVITPLFNGEHFVRSYLESLIKQRFFDWEAIVVDDESTDKSVDLLISLTQSDERFRVVRNYPSNEVGLRKGPYRPRNHGLSMATGKYICFLDVDDYWLPSKLLDQYNLLSDNPKLKLLFSNYCKADSTLSLGYLKPRLNMIPIKTQSFMWNPIPNLTSCVSRDVASMFRFKPIGHEDFLYWHEIILSLDASQIGMTDKVLAIYRTSAQSTSGNKLKILGWWVHCYRLMGHSFILAILLLLVKVMLEIVEYSSRAVGFMPTIQLINLIDQDRRQH